ncbi:vWA domain-containing protein [Ferruginibacter albus]|uniref:vWA domain-containing protein n=1 Tax=Ferruginibacter albus TaxID=2875540 RepID=UPI001CC4D91B|nr:von Willebrand factor type A domain-containing protein [Ferruginibacter albus]UAY52689.1 von Willebrand factor type A domain-containing protein [Ferruginibacter albus]
MKKLLLYIFFILFSGNLCAQYYFTGEIKNTNGELLQNVKILIRSTRMLYYGGNDGSYGITSKTATDSATFSLDGYETKIIQLKNAAFQSLVLRSFSAKLTRSTPHLNSITTDISKAKRFIIYPEDDSYFSFIENQTANAKQYPNTAFSLNIDKASYSNIHRFLNFKTEVPPDAVHIEELLNYFGLHYREPDNNEPFKIESFITDCPWNLKNKLLYLAINAKKIELTKVPPCNLIFLLDASGSMDMPNKLPLIKAAFQLLVKNLRPEDTVSIIIYGGSVETILPPTSGSEKQKLIQAIEQITPNGDTPGEAAIRAAYKAAEKTFNKKANNKIILATDGDFNVAQTTEEELEKLVEKESKAEIYLSCIGVGNGNLKDSSLHVLAKKGSGNYAYLDNINDAEKMLLKEMTQTIFAVANNASVNVEFNTEVIQQYRLIGFDNKKDLLPDSTLTLPGGEIGSGSNVLATFEITPASSLDSINKTFQQKVADVYLKYNLPGEAATKQSRYICLNDYTPLKNIDKDIRFATAVNWFGLKLRTSKFIGVTGWTDIENLALTSVNADDYLQKEFLTLVGIAKKVYAKKKKYSSD